MLSGTRRGIHVAIVIVIPAVDDPDPDLEAVAAHAAETEVEAEMLGATGTGKEPAAEAAAMVGEEMIGRSEVEVVTRTLQKDTRVEVVSGKGTKMT
jgi:hypothetical protein